jgi:hypothetical protein
MKKSTSNNEKKISDRKENQKDEQFYESDPTRYGMEGLDAYKEMAEYNRASMDGGWIE